MAVFEISRGGVLPNRFIRPLSLPSGETIDTVTEVEATDGLTVTDEAPNDSTVTDDDGVTYAAGLCIVFTLSASETCGLHPTTPHRVVFSYTSSGGQTLRVGATVEVVPFVR